MLKVMILCNNYQIRRLNESSHIILIITLVNMMTNQNQNLNFIISTQMVWSSGNNFSNIKPSSYRHSMATSPWYVSSYSSQLTPALSWWLGSWVVSVLDSDAEGPRFKSQSRCCRVTVLGKLFTPIVPLFSSPSSKIGISPLKGCGNNCRPGRK